jgi:hypothetical protein
VSDQYFYGLDQVAGLISVANDPHFDGKIRDGVGGGGGGIASESGNLLAMVADIKRAQKAGWRDALGIQRFLNSTVEMRLRRAQSNASAQALTRGLESEGVSHGHDNR